MRNRMLIPLAIAATIVGALLLPSQPALAGGTCHKGRPVTDARSTTVTMSGNCFVATITRVDEGATVSFTNEDEAEHAVTGANYAWGIGSDDATSDATLAKGDRYEQRFADSGVYPYFCFLHPGMIGAIVVGDGAGASAATTGAVSANNLASSAPQRNDMAAEAAAIPFDTDDAREHDRRHGAHHSGRNPAGRDCAPGAEVGHAKAGRRLTVMRRDAAGRSIAAGRAGGCNDDRSPILGRASAAARFDRGLCRVEPRRRRRRADRHRNAS